MSTIYKNLTYSELIKLAPKDKPFQVRLESNSKILWGYIQRAENILATVDPEFGFTNDWDCNYNDGNFNGKFDLITDPWDSFPKQEIKVGDVFQHNETGWKYTVTDINSKGDSNIVTLSSSTQNRVGKEDILFRYYTKIGNTAPTFKETIQIGSDIYELTDEFKEALKTLKKID